MKLEIKNIGKFRNDSESVFFDGITVLAGVNNSGKSTISKSLYCIFSTLYDIDKKIERKRFRELYSAINSWDWKNMFQPLIDKILTMNNIDEIKSLLYSYYLSILEDENIVYEDVNYGCKKKPNITNINHKVEIESKKIYNILSKKKDIYFRDIINDSFNSEFSGQINNLYNFDNAIISLHLKSNIYKFEFNNNVITNMQIAPEKIKHMIKYFDGTQIVSNNLLNNGLNLITHNFDFINKVLNKNKSNNIKYFDIIEKYNDVFDWMVKYKFDINEYNRHVTINFEKMHKPLEFNQLSSGLKSIALLNNLFLSDFLVEENLLILDEPEVHLHPEWQIRLAEALVILQKELHLTLLISTHSPYFLNAIDTYSFKYGTNEICKYYLIQEDTNGLSGVKDVSDMIDDIYNELAKPFEELQNEREGIINDRK